VTCDLRPAYGEIINAQGNRKEIKKPLKEGKRQITILIVEDDDDLRESLAASLSDEGYHVVWAQDADEAIKNVKAHKVNIVFMDICLPDMSGWKSIRSSKRCNPPQQRL